MYVFGSTSIFIIAIPSCCVSHLVSVSPMDAMNTDGFAPCWQVCYPDRSNVMYWWDYPKNINSLLEHALANNEMASFVWDWGSHKKGQLDTYVADPLHNTVENHCKAQSTCARFAVF